MVLELTDPFYCTFPLFTLHYNIKISGVLIPNTCTPQQGKATHPQEASPFFSQTIESLMIFISIIRYFSPPVIKNTGFPNIKLWLFLPLHSPSNRYAENPRAVIGGGYINIYTPLILAKQLIRET